MQVFGIQKVGQSRVALGAAAVVASCLAWTPAHAVPLAALLPLPIVQPMGTDCQAQLAQPDLAVGTVSDSRIDKSAAILGGTMSALDRIRLQQSQAALAASPAPVPVAASMASDPLRDAFCTASQSIAPDPAASQTAPPVPEDIAPRATDFPAADFLATTRIRIGSTRLNAQWDRVSHAAIGSINASELLGVASQSPDELVGRVNSWVNHSIVHGDDARIYGRPDYWATAEQTLRSGRGDCEDFAILKYQLLAAMGFDRQDMFLTLARDLARGADHAVLIVQLGGAYYMLDNATDLVLPADQSYDYRPVLSFGENATWLHGYTNEAASRRFAYLSVNATSSPRVIGLSR